MHQLHSPAGVMRRHGTTATPFENEMVETLWVWTMFFVSSFRGKHASTPEAGWGPTEHRQIGAYRHPLASIQRPPAWLTRMPCACMLRCLGHVRTMFCAQLARFAIAQCRSWLVAKITLVVSIVPQVAASLVEAQSAKTPKIIHGEENGDANVPMHGSQVCIPASGGTHTAAAHTFARVRSHCTRAQPRTHTLAC